MTNIDSAIKQANEFLAMGGIPLKIQRPEQTGTLYLRGTWASIGQERKSQRIALGIKATSAGIEEAKELAREAWIVIKAGGDPKASLKARQTALKVQNTLLTGSEKPLRSGRGAREPTTI